MEKGEDEMLCGPGTEQIHSVQKAETIEEVKGERNAIELNQNCCTSNDGSNISNNAHSQSELEIDMKTNDKIPPTGITSAYEASSSNTSTSTTSHSITNISDETDDPDTYSKLFECQTCGRLCKSRPKLLQHMLIHNGKKHQCGNCDKKFTSNFKLEEHSRVHTGICPFKCAQCEKQFRAPSTLKAHVKKVHLREISSRPKPEFICRICNRILQSKRSLLNHDKTHLEKTIHKCPFCPRNFQKNRVLVLHIRGSHNPKYAAKESTECPICFKKLHPKSMRPHMRVHSNEKPHECPICSMTFRTNSNLESHSWIHKKVVKPYKCSKCPKSYQFKRLLEKHMMVHKNRASHHTCNECGAKFTRKENLNRHVEEHGNAKKYECKTCGKTFQRKYYLVEHERIHQGIRLFTCLTCGKKSTNQSNHRAHIKIHARGHSLEV